MTISQTAKMVNPSHNAQSHSHCDVLVIGAGLAGLATALSLPKHLQVTVLAKEALSACSSYYAQGGIAAVIDSDDKVADHVSDTLIAGDGLCDVDATTQILAQGAKAIDWLLEHDVPFTTNTHGESIDSDLSKNLTLADLHLTQEGGHGCRRVAHADDATGRHIMIQLHQQAQVAENINLLPYHEALQLITVTAEDNHSKVDCDRNIDNAEGHGSEVKRCIGAEVINSQTNELFSIISKSVVLASGGLGQLFSRATAPNVCVGDGIMMAWEAGCRLANLEFIQFHPTGLVYEDEDGSSNFLISEAVRGEGGLLRCPLTHERFMPNYDAREELAPRDIVARAIANEIANNGLGYVHLDISHKPAQFIKQHFPDIYAQCLSLGIDITKQSIPVAPTAHYTCGGILTNAQGQTDVQGLYAAGEVANTGLHGANRLASNSLLECVVVGRAIASQLAHQIDSHNSIVGINSSDRLDMMDSSENFPWATIVKNHPPLEHYEIAIEVNADTDNFSLSKATIDSSNPNIDFKQQLRDLKQLMTENMGIRRNANDLKQALEQVIGLKQKLQLKQDLEFEKNLAFENARCSTNDDSERSNPTLTNTELNNFRLMRLLTLASLLLQSALTRTESRGGHFRDDHPSFTESPTISIVTPLSDQTSVNTKHEVNNNPLTAVINNHASAKLSLKNDKQQQHPEVSVIPEGVDIEAKAS